MSLEACGKFIFSRLSAPFFFALAMLPLLAAALFLFFQYSQIEELEERVAKAARKEKIAFERKARKERLIARYCRANPYFLDQNLESFSPLQNERQKLESLLHHPAFPNHQSISDRLAFLNENRFAFAEEHIQTSSQMKEVEEKLRRSVQIDEQDLQKILSLLEDVPVGPYLPSTESPQILIKDFRLKKQKTPLRTEVFEVEMDLLKREFIKP